MTEEGGKTIEEQNIYGEFLPIIDIERLPLALYVDRLALIS